MQAESPTRARARFAAAICERAVRDHGLLLSLTGTTGAGKTWIVRRIAKTMCPHSTVHYSTADEFEKNEPYSFIEHLLIAGVAGLDLLDSDLQPAALARVLLKELSERRSEKLQTIIIDDAQWVDAASAQVIRYLVPRIMRLGYFIVVAARTPEIEDSSLNILSSLAESAPRSVRRVLEPLTVDEIRALAKEKLGSAISERTAAAMMNATGGSFLAIDAILDNITPEEKSRLHLQWDLPIRGLHPDSNPWLTVLSDLTPAARTSVEIVCTADTALSPAEIAKVAEVLGEDHELAPAITASVLSESGFGQTVIPRHSLIAHAVRNALSPERIRAIYQALVPLACGFRRIQYTLWAADTWTPELAETVDGYIADALELRAYEDINDVLRRCLTIAEGTEHDRLLTTLALINMRNKTVFSLLDLYPQVEALPEGPYKECIAITFLAHRSEEDFPRERLDRFLALETTDPDTRVMQTFVAFLSVYVTLRSDRYDAIEAAVAAAKTIIDRSPRTVAEVSNPCLHWMVSPQALHTLLDSYSMVQPTRFCDIETITRRLPALIAQVRALEPDDRKADSLIPLAGAALAIGDAQLAHELAEEAVTLLDIVENPWGAGTIRLLHAHMTSLLGTLPQALELVEIAEDFGFRVIDVETRLTIRGLSAWLHAASGATELPDLTEDAYRLESMAWEPYAPDMMVIADCEIARTRGDAEAIITATGPERVGRFRSVQHGFLTYRVHALIDLGRLSEAADLLDTLAQLRGTGWQEFWGTLDWARARYAQARLAEAAPESADEARAEVVRLFESAVEEKRYRLPLALTLFDQGRFLASIGQEAEALDVLDEARRVAEAIGAHAYTGRISEAITVVTNRKHEILETLTDREREISLHLAEGLSNQDIAAKLFLAPATVRYHVSNLLRKLELSRRSDVAALVNESRRSAQNREAAGD